MNKKNKNKEKRIKKNTKRNKKGNKKSIIKAGLPSEGCKACVVRVSM